MIFLAERSGLRFARCAPTSNLNGIEPVRERRGNGLNGSPSNWIGTRSEKRVSSWAPTRCIATGNRKSCGRSTLGLAVAFRAEITDHSTMSFDLKEIVAARLGDNYQLHEKHLNRTLVAAQRVIGFDKVYARAEGAYLYDMDNAAYLDFLSGYSVFNIGRNHPAVKQAIRDVLDLDLPNMVQMDCSLLSGLLAEAITKRTPPHLDAVFFCNSGTEAMEGALKFARAATGKKRVVSLARAFHRLSLASLSLMGCESITGGFGPLMEGFAARVPLDDIDELDRQLRSRDVAAFVIETVQGKGCQTSKTDFFPRAQELCRKYGTLLISDEVQTGLGRTGKMFGFQHWNLEPDIITLAKTLSGGYVPCGAIVTRREIYQKTFSRMDRCV